MDLKELQKNWDEFGRIDPLWAILTLPDKKDNKWDINEFFQSGQKEIDDIMHYTQSIGISFPRRRALDFGCGVGRLTQALCNYFDEVCGVDIAPSMIDLSKKLNRYEGRCSYFLNERDDLKIFEDNKFDFIYTNITLQHMKPVYSKKYIQEFLRILSPNGVLIFQLPSQLYNVNLIQKIVYKLRPFLYNFKLYRQLRYGNRPLMEMYGIKKEEVVSFLEQCGGKLIDIQLDENLAEWESYRYCVVKQ